MSILVIQHKTLKVFILEPHDLKSKGGSMGANIMSKEYEDRGVM